MKKHRNFLLSYSLWLGMIIAILIGFDSPQEKNIPIANQRTVCAASTGPTEYTEPTKCPEKWSCESNRPNTASTLH